MMPHEIQQDSWKQLAGEAAAKLIEDGMVIGLGSGSTAAYLIYALARRIQAGLSIVGAVPTSKVTGELASNLGIPLTDLDTHPELDRKNSRFSSTAFHCPCRYIQASTATGTQNASTC
jgi:hypothetical protein